MIALKDYKVNLKIYDGVKNVIYRGQKKSNKLPVVIKILNKKYPTNEDLKQFKSQYEIAKSLYDIDGVIKTYDLIPYQNSMAIIMEDIDGDSLDEAIKDKKGNIVYVLDLMIDMSNIVSRIHDKHVIHKDLKPQNFIINKNNGKIKLIDFSLSTKFSRENQEVMNPGHLEGTLAYISPEQTGRMNRVIDYRTDFYSLGIIFYEFLTGILPFQSHEAMELVHCHIAKMPSPPHEKNSDVPIGLSNIVMKLISKNAEDRYKSSYGLISDLEECRKIFRNNGSFSNFVAGKNDVSNRFQIPEKLYGREEELKHLMSVFNSAASGQKGIIFFSGAPGVGKSALINEVYKPITQRRGYFIRGKYEPFKASIPYSAIIQAFQELSKQILTDSKEKIEIWKKKILDAVGRNGRVITKVIPEIEFIIGKQPKLESLSLSETELRFNMIFQNFVKIFAANEHPLVLFLDDLQWIDNSSLQFIELLLDDSELNHFLFIGAYRDNEVDKSHPFRIMFNNIKKKGFAWEDIKLDTLSGANITQLISDTLYCDLAKAKPLAEIVFEKTNGNPFFVNEFLKSLFYDEKLIDFKEGWSWDIKKIKNLGITDNVVQLMANKIKKLPENTWNTLKVAACVGVKFYLDILSFVIGKSEDEVFFDLTEIINDGLILKIGLELRFAHDRVREAAYSLISKEEKETLHYNIGRQILEKAKKEKFLEDKIFNVVNQLNLAKGKLSDKEKIELIKLNYDAAIKAKASTAYNAALDFVNNGMALLGEDSWSNMYEQAVLFNLEKAETEFLTKNYKKAEEYYKILLNNVDTLEDKIKIYNQQAVHKALKFDYKGSLKKSVIALRLLGISVPKKASIPLIIIEFIKVNFALGKRDIEDLFNLPEIKEQKLITTFEVIKNIAFYADVTLYPILIMKSINLILKNGNSFASSYIFSNFAVILTGAMGDVKRAYKFSKLAIKLAEKYKLSSYLGKSYFYMGFFVAPWNNHLRNSIDYLLKAFKYSVEAGDLEYIQFFIQAFSLAKLFLGEELNSVLESAFEYKSMIKRFRADLPELTRVLLQFILVLTGKTDDLYLLVGSEYNEKKEFKKDTSGDYSALSCYYFSKMFLHYFYGKYDKAMDFATKEAEDIVTNGAFGIYLIAQYYFIYALNLAALYPTASLEDQKIYMKKLESILKKMDMWAKNCPENFLHKLLLIKAEFSRITDKNNEAEKFYDDALKIAKQNKYVQDEGLINECAAKYYIAAGREKFAQIYMNDALYCYTKWGAFPKIKQMKESYSELFEFESLGNASLSRDVFLDTSPLRRSDSNGKFSTSKTINEILDLSTVMKASQTISGEIVMKKLLMKLIKIVIENAGAQKGFLILKNEANDLFIEAECEADKKDAIVLQSIPLDEFNKLSPAIVRYAEKTTKAIILNNASNEGMFTTDPYIINKKPESVLCMPIVKQGDLIGLLYLENDLTTGAFTEGRLEILNMLSSQIAISIENARLYQDLKEKERLKKEMEIAEKIQTALVPDIPDHEELEITGFMKPAEEVGGDYFDIVYDNFDNLWFAIGDVSGHGVTPGLIMMMAQASFNSYINYSNLTPKDAMRHVNSLLASNIRNRLRSHHFMTMNFVKYLGNGKFVTSNAGHPEIIIYRAAAKECELIYLEGIYLGIKFDESEMFLTSEFYLATGDIMVLYTDGIIESRHKKNRKCMGVDKLMKIIVKNASKDLKKLQDVILDETLSWCGYKPADDITMILVKKK